MYFDSFFIKYCLKVKEIKKNKSFIGYLSLVLAIIVIAAIIVILKKFTYGGILVIAILVIRYFRLEIEKKLISFYENFSYKRKEALLELLNEYNIDIKDIDSFLKIIKEKK